jgi:hypothetical protein
LGLKGTKNIICSSGSNYIGQLGDDTTNDTQTFTCNTGEISVGLQNVPIAFDPIQVYPNPSFGYFNIKLNDSEFHQYDLNIYSSIGKLVLSKKITTSDFSIDLQQNTKGIYYLKFENKQTVITKKILIQ